MKIRTLLFMMIPLLFVVNSAISLLLFDSSHRVNQSYAQLQERMLVYERVQEHVQHQVQLARSWLTSRLPEQISALQTNSELIASLQEQLQGYSPPVNAEAEALSLQKLLATFLEHAQQFSDAMAQEETLTLSAYVEEAQLIASYISEECFRLISLELSAYETRYHSILQNMSFMRISGTILLLGVLLLCLWLAYIISQSISRPIGELVQTAEAISQGKLDGPIPLSPKQNEFHSLGNAFQRMQVQLKQYIAKEKETLEKDKQLKEMELEVLKSQINPHFLFNSLNVVSKLALIEGAERTSDLTVAISNLLRYSLKQLDSQVPLRDEVKHARDYVYIQQARYRERVQFHMDIDEVQLDTTVPVLTIQPILENIFVHGIEQLEHGAQITLRIYGDERYTWIAIADNGSGMSEQTRLQLLQYTDKEQTKLPSVGQSTGLGTRNVFRRLQLLYGDEHQVEIESTQDKGTSITLRIPKQKEE